MYCWSLIARWGICLSQDDWACMDFIRVSAESPSSLTTPSGYIQFQMLSSISLCHLSHNSAKVICAPLITLRFYIFYPWLNFYIYYKCVKFVFFSFFLFFFFVFILLDHVVCVLVLCFAFHCSAINCPLGTNKVTDWLKIVETHAVETNINIILCCVISGDLPCSSLHV